MNDIERRIERLETENLTLRRRLRGLQGATFGSVLMAATALLLGDAVGEPPPSGALPGWGFHTDESAQPPVAEVVRARRFEVVGADDRKFVAALGSTPTGDGFLETRTGEGWRNTFVGRGEEGRALIAGYESEGALSFRLVSRPVGAELFLGGTPGRPAVRLESNERGEGSWALFNGGGFEIASVKASTTGAAQLRTFDEAGHPLVTLGEGKTGQGEVQVANDLGYTILDLGSDASKNGRFQVGSNEGLVLLKLPEPPRPVAVNDGPPLPPASPPAAEPAPAKP